MNTNKLPLRPWQAGLIALLAEALHLLWEQAHGGIRVHHLLQREDLPGLSNAWGLLMLPLLAAWTATRLRRRGADLRGAARAALPALLLGAALATSFALGHEGLTQAIFFGTGLVALLLPVHRSECLLAWVLGMSWTFGALLPLAIGSLLVAGSALVHGLLLPALQALWRRLSAPAG